MLCRTTTGELLHTSGFKLVPVSNSSSRGGCSNGCSIASFFPMVPDSLWGSFRAYVAWRHLSLRGIANATH